MPVKDLTGPPPLTREDQALIIELHRRLGLPLPKRPGFRDEGEPDPVPVAPRPGSGPLMGGAEAIADR